MPEQLLPGRRLPTRGDKLAPFEDFEPGDYCGPVYGYATDNRPAVYFLLPIARDEHVPDPGARAFHHVASPPHTFTEEPDGTLTISASIGAGKPPYYWHGFLERGIWRRLDA